VADERRGEEEIKPNPWLMENFHCLVMALRMSEAIFEGGKTDPLSDIFLHSIGFDFISSSYCRRFGCVPRSINGVNDPKRRNGWRMNDQRQGMDGE